MKINKSLSALMSECRRGGRLISIDEYVFPSVNGDIWCATAVERNKPLVKGRWPRVVASGKTPEEAIQKLKDKIII